MITYPRLCSVCSYSANNPAMYHYHVATHDPIPLDTPCFYGCGRPARFKKTSGKTYCVESPHDCPEYRKQHALRVKRQWDKNEWKDRRLRFATIRERMTEEQKRQHDDAQRVTKRSRGIAGDNTKERRVYSRAVIYYSRQTYKQYKELLNPNNYPIGRGRDKYSIDHKVSRHEGWNAKIPVEVMSCVLNLQVIPNIQNSKKGPKCELLPTELLEQFNRLANT